MKWFSFMLIKTAKLVKNKALASFQLICGTLKYSFLLSLTFSSSNFAAFLPLFLV